MNALHDTSAAELRAAADDADLSVQLDRFTELVLSQGRVLYRDLPWRNIDDPYAVLVSEVMLQQTQVARVVNYWSRFMSVFPTVDALAAAHTSDVLELWQGLGYNRRALMLKRAADQCAQQHAGTLPRSEEELLALPGVGPATAAGVMAFAYDQPAMYLETNVRTVFIHEFFPDGEAVKDREIIPLVKATCPQADVRRWYYALLDYGAHLKATIPNPSRRSAHHAKQSTFEGSNRQKRAELVRIVLAAGEDGVSLEEATFLLNRFELAAGRDGLDRAQVAPIVEQLVGEGFFRKEGSLFLA